MQNNYFFSLFYAAESSVNLSTYSSIIKKNETNYPPDLTFFILLI